MADQRDTPSVLIHRYGRAGDATTVIESPRGTLSHRIALDEKGMVTDCRILTPAVVNRLALIDDIITLARSLDGMDSDNLRELIVLLVRSYRICAPCLVR
jgi:coenzyme F420-reducing hydrogenase alpha subunit